MSIYIFIIVWIFATYPITKKINDRMVEKDDEDVHLISFQILLQTLTFIILNCPIVNDAL